MPDFNIEKYDEAEFDSEKFYFDNKNHVIEGKKITIKYYHNAYKEKDAKFPTRLQILRNYSNAIEKKGGTILFERYNSEHGYYNFSTEDQKKIWIKVSVARFGHHYNIKIIEQEEMRQDIVITANLIKYRLEINGRITLDGIFFDLGQSIIREESQAAISEIAKYLNSNPTIKCWVVGHTSSEGSFQTNSDLSLSRTKAIKEELENAHNLTPGRLIAEGVGPLAPAATNGTEDGRKQNRRVELVLKEK